MERLIEGFKRFRAEYFEPQRARFERLAERPQHPQYAIITCSDSRIDVARMFDAVPGEIFLIRNIASLVPPYEPDEHHHSTSAAIEYAVRFLKVGQFVILGHAGCGGIRALLEPPQAETDFLTRWLAIATPARQRTLAQEGLSAEERLRFCEHEALKSSLANVLAFPWVSERVKDGSLHVDAMYVALDRGELQLYTPTGDTFLTV